MSQNCYRFEQIKYSDGLLSDSIDATYIIHLENNGRIKDIQKQLQEYHPTNIVYIVYNKGYKKCRKQDYIKNSAHDLVDANIEICKHAENQKYSNILVLEDDFMFSPKIKEDEHTKNICTFLKETENFPVFYLLGCVPVVLIPYDFNHYHYKSLVTGGTHAVVINEKMRNIILSETQEEIDDWDKFPGLNYYNYKYTYHTPLCYQLFQDTDNSKIWGGDNIFFKLYCRLAFYIFYVLNMHKQVEPGYSLFYAFSKITIILITMLILYIIVKFLILGQRRNR